MNEGDLLNSLSFQRDKMILSEKLIPAYKCYRWLSALLLNVPQIYQNCFHKCRLT